jgi:hypothetical protein
MARVHCDVALAFSKTSHVELRLAEALMFKTIIATSFAALALAWAVAAHSNPPPALPPSSIDSDAEPIVGEPIMPLAGSETPPRDHFKPFDPGPESALWKYEDLTPAEKKVADRGRDTTGWRGIHDAYRAAVLERVPRIRAQAAASKIGAHDLETLGVVR